MAQTLTRVDRIGVQVQQVDPAQVVQRAVLTVLAAAMWLLGAVPGFVVRTVVWCFVAVRVGYRDGRGLAPLGDGGS